MKVGQTNFNISVKSYLGKIDKGVLVLLSIKYNNNTDIYEGTYWYTEDIDIITFNNDLKEIVGDFERLNDTNKKSIISFLRNNTSEYIDIIGNLSEVDLT